MPSFIRTALSIFLTAAAALAAYFLLPADCPEPARRAAAIFIIAAVFWACEIIPLYATSFLVVVLEIFLLSGPKMADYASFLKPFANPVIMLFLGGFVIARALRRHQLDETFAEKMLIPFGHKPYGVLLGFMSVTAFLSMWMSNTATAALMLALIPPVLCALDSKDPFRKALVFGIALAANFGGVATPVGTPPNAVAMGLLAQKGYTLQFSDWMMIGVPLMILFVFVTSLLLLRFFVPQKNVLDFQLKAPARVTGQGKGVIAVGLGAIMLWLTSPLHGIPEAVVALTAVAVLTGFRLIDAADIRKIEWDMLILIWGGLSLSAGLESSGLAQWLMKLPIFSLNGIALALIFLFFTVGLSTFMSNTAAVNLIIPLILSLPVDSRFAIAVMVAIASSLDLPLPMATPPMAIAYGTGELKISDMLRVGFVVTVITNIILFGAVYVWSGGELF